MMSETSVVGVPLTGAGPAPLKNNLGPAIWFPNNNNPPTLSFM